METGDKMGTSPNRAASTPSSEIRETFLTSFNKTVPALLISPVSEDGGTGASGLRFLATLPAIMSLKGEEITETIKTKKKLTAK